MAHLPKLTAAEPICVFLPNRNVDDGIRKLKRWLGREAERWKGKKVIIVSFAGNSGSGKSFLLDLMIRRMKADNKSHGRDFETDEKLVQYFKSKLSQYPVTHGVLVWPEIFEVPDSSGKEVGVIFMDTQGLFDPETNPNDQGFLFAFNALLSSVQIFNYKDKLSSDQLRHMNIFTDLSRVVSERTERQLNQDKQKVRQKPFQRLIFLNRDYTYTDEHPLGWEGGQRRLDELLDPNAVWGTTGETLRACFDSVEAFHMPSPGDRVTRRPFSGFISDIEGSFFESMDEFMNNIFLPKNLTSIRGTEIGNLARLVPLYAAKLASGEYQSPEPHVDAYAAGQNAILIEELSKNYVQTMENLVRNSPLEDHQFEQYHQEQLRGLHEAFMDSVPFGSESTINGSSENLSLQVNLRKKYFAEKNREAYIERQNLALLKAGGVGFLAGAIAGGIAGAQSGSYFGMLCGGYIGGPVPAAVGCLVGGVLGAAAGALAYVAARAVSSWFGSSSRAIGSFETRPSGKKYA